MNWKVKQASADSSVSPVTFVLNIYKQINIFKGFFLNWNIPQTCKVLWGHYSHNKFLDADAGDDSQGRMHNNSCGHLS